MYAIRILNKFTQLESSSGIVLFAAAVLAICLANSPLVSIYQEFSNTFLLPINEGLMAIFFLLITMELKRGWVEGELSSFSHIALPGMAALGGMLIPALLYLLVNIGSPQTLKGWATPVATDVAFALGTLSLFGKRVPQSLKLFLLALAIFDDVGAIIVIIFFYSQQLNYLLMGIVILLLGGLFALNYFSIQVLSYYLLLGLLIWICLLPSGVHPTVAGVLLALALPCEAHKPTSPLRRLEIFLHPWVAYLIMPLFAFVNAGFSLRDFNPSTLTSGITLGIVLGLFLGKQAGVFGFASLMIKLKWAKLPKNTSWLAFYGVAILCGIGFTMSLFLGTLSFQNETTYLTEMRLGVIIGSIFSGMMGVFILLIAYSGKRSRSL